MKKLYRIKWIHPKSKRVHIGPILIHMHNKKFYTLKEAENICKRFNKNSDIIHTVYDSIPVPE